MDCDHCQARVAAEHVDHYDARDSDDNQLYRYYFLRCPTCGDPFVAISMCLGGDPDDGLYFDEPERFLPRPEHLDLATFPKAIAAAYEEARRCYRAKAFTAAAVMCRKTLEGICAEHGIAERNLAGALKQMRDRGIMDDRLFQWADALRISGNEAAHGVEVNFGPADARDIVEFTKALLEYVFTFRDRFDAFQKRRAAKGGAA